MRRNGRMLCFYIYMNMYMCIYIHIKQKFCALILGFSRSRERKLLLKWSLQNGLFSHSLVSKKASKVCGARCELFFYSFSYPSWLIGGHKLTKILLCTAFVNFYFPSEFCHLRCLVGKATVLCWLFSVVTGEKKKKNVNMELHMLDMVIFACWVVCASRCWTGITRSLPQIVQGVSFVIVIFFLKLSLLQCWLKFVCLH